VDMKTEFYEAMQVLCLCKIIIYLYLQNKITTFSLE